MDDKLTPQPVPGQVQIKADERELQGMYSNLVMVHHHIEEFTLNFVYVFPEWGAGKAPGQHDRQPRTCQAHLARLGRECRPIRSTVWAYQGRPGRRRARPRHRLRAIGFGFPRRNSVRFCAASDHSLLVYLGEEIGLPAHHRVVKLLQLLQQESPKWLINLQPAYCSLLVTFDVCQIDHGQVEAELRRRESQAAQIPLRESKLVEIPVCYGGDFGPDLEDVATSCKLSAEEVIALHSSQTYHAYFLGFAPGFAYLGDLPEFLALPRLSTPRKQVPAGSVAIAARQTAIYPFATPGGWRLLGRTSAENVSCFQKRNVVDLCG